MKKISGACTRTLKVLAAGGDPVCHCRIVASWSDDSATGAGSCETPNAWAHCFWSYCRPKSEVSVYAAPRTIHSGK